MAILADDAVGFSARVSEDETGAIRAVKAYLDILQRTVALHGGRVFRTMDCRIAALPNALSRLIGSFGAAINSLRGISVQHTICI